MVLQSVVCQEESLGGKLPFANIATVFVLLSVSRISRVRSRDPGLQHLIHYGARPESESIHKAGRPFTKRGYTVFFGWHYRGCCRELSHAA
jgi:hypothetical protein